MAHSRPEKRRDFLRCGDGAAELRRKVNLAPPLPCSGMGVVASRHIALRSQLTMSGGVPVTDVVRVVTAVPAPTATAPAARTRARRARFSTLLIQHDQYNLFALWTALGNLFLTALNAAGIRGWCGSTTALTPGSIQSEPLCHKFILLAGTENYPPPQIICNHLA